MRVSICKKLDTAGRRINKAKGDAIIVDFNGSKFDWSNGGIHVMTRDNDLDDVFKKLIDVKLIDPKSSVYYRHRPKHDFEQLLPVVFVKHGDAHKVAASLKR